MAGELFVSYGAAVTLYALLFDRATRKVWNGTAFETFASANYATYDIPLTQGGDGPLYSADYPSDVPTGTDWFCEFRVQSGGSAVSGDSRLPDELTGRDSVTAITPTLGTTQYLTEDELRDFITNDVASGADAGTFDGEALTEAILIREADINGCLAAIGKVQPTLASNPISFRYVKLIVKYLAAADSRQAIFPAETAEDLQLINMYRVEGLRMRTEIKENPGQLSDAEDTDPGGFGGDSSNNLRGWTAADMAAADPKIERKFTTQNKQF